MGLLFDSYAKFDLLSFFRNFPDINLSNIPDIAWYTFLNLLFAFVDLWSSSSWFGRILIFIVAYHLLLKHLFGPMIKETPPESYFILNFGWGQPFGGWYAINSAKYHSNLKGELIPGQSLLGFLNRLILGNRVVIIGWPFLRIRKTNPDRSSPQVPLSVEGIAITIVVPDVELAPKTKGSESYDTRVVSFLLIHMPLCPKDFLYGVVPKNWANVLQEAAMGAVRKIAATTTVMEAQSSSGFQDKLSKETILKGWLFGRQRSGEAANFIADQLKLRIIAIRHLDIRPIKSQEKARDTIVNESARLEILARENDINLAYLKELVALGGAAEAFRMFGMDNLGAPGSRSEVVINPGGK